jgi:hypothetical protein
VVEAVPIVDQVMEQPVQVVLAAVEVAMVVVLLLQGIQEQQTPVEVVVQQNQVAVE